MFVTILNPFFPPWAPGGAEHSLEQLCQKFASHGWEILVVAISLDGRSGLEHHKNFAVHWLPAPIRVPPGQEIPDIPYLGSSQYMNELRTEFNRLDRKPDMLIANNAQSYIVTAKLSSVSGINSIGIVRDTQMICESGACMDNTPAKLAFPCQGGVEAGRCNIRFHRYRGNTDLRPLPAWFWQGMSMHGRRLALRRAARNFKYLVTISDSLNLLVRKTLPAFPAERIVTIRNLPTIVEPASTASVQDFLSSRGLARRRYFLFAGRKTHGKGADLAVQAMQFIRERGDDAQLILAGRGTVDVVENEGVWDEPSVSQAMLMALLENAAALLIPGRWQEGLHRTMIDALRLGVPVICSQAGAPPVDGVVNNETGYVVPCNDAPALADAMLKVLGWGEDTRYKCRLASHARFEEGFSSRVIMRQWQNLLVQSP